MAYSFDILINRSICDAACDFPREHKGHMVTHNGLQTEKIFMYLVLAGCCNIFI